MTSQRAIVHLGTHKTGSTSFQRILANERVSLEKQGFLVLRDSINTGAQSWDLANIAVRMDLDAPFRQLRPSTVLPSVRSTAQATVRRQVESPAPTVVASMECLSLIRTRDEVDALLGALHPRHVSVVVCVRDRETFLRSYERTLASNGIRPHRDGARDSACYVGRDSWVSNWHELVKAFVEVVGADSVQVIEYEAAIQRDGSVLPALWEAFGFPESCLSDPNMWLEKTNYERNLDEVDTLLTPSVLRELQHYRSSRPHRIAARLSASYRAMRRRG